MATAAIVGAALVVAACGGGKSSGGGGSDDGGSTGKPVAGGDLVYGLEAENNGGWCLPEGQLAISGIQVARAVYDTLTAPNADDKYVPYLAESVTSDAGYQNWTIKLRPNIKFHDGSALNATVVKNNLDAFRGKYPARKPLLFIFVLQNIKDVTVVDDLTVNVSTNTPWPSFPAFLHSSGRLGMMGQAQLDDPTTCDRNLIGTGPFKLKEWKPDDRLTVVKNADYWRKDKDGNQMPYLDSITFKPYPDAQARLNALQSGELTAGHYSGAEQIDSLRTAKENGSLQELESEKFTELSYGLLNAGKPPFNNKNARLAVAYGVNRETFNKALNLDILTNASGPFAPGEIGYVKDAGYPEYSLEKCKEYAAKYQEETGGALEFSIISTPDPGVVKSVQFLQAEAEKCGAKVTLDTRDQAALITTALGGNFQAMSWRNHPGGDPDLQYVWWKGGAPTNFGRFNDPKIDSLLDLGRITPDREKRQEIYADINKQFSAEAWNLWLQWSLWTIGSQPGVNGILGPDMPDGSGPFPGLATGHPLEGIWIQK